MNAVDDVTSLGAAVPLGDWAIIPLRAGASGLLTGLLTASVRGVAAELEMGAAAIRRRQRVRRSVRRR